MYSEINTFLLVAGLVGGLLLGAFQIALTWRVCSDVQTLLVEFVRFLDQIAGDHTDGRNT